jgi:hypothetical protein
LCFEVEQVHDHLTDFHKEQGVEVETGASVYLAAVLEYLCAEILGIP